MDESKVRLVVDSDSLLTWISRDRLVASGIHSTGMRRIKTIEGKEVRRETGEVVMEIMGAKATRVVVFAERGDAEVLGADALEGLGLEVDPFSRALRKTEVFAAYRN